MNDNSTLLSTFYTAFQQRDYASMIACYHPDIHFFDPVFTNLQGKRAGAMWHMLCERGTDLQATFSDIQADDKKGQAHWEATYSFGKNGRLIHNIIDATFTFQSTHARGTLYENVAELSTELESLLEQRQKIMEQIDALPANRTRQCDQAKNQPGTHRRAPLQ